MRLISTQSGFTLLEVVISVLVLAIGLLGLASLQAVGLQFNQSSQFRTQATNLAYEMADRMRSNRQAARDGDYDGGLADPLTDCTPNLALDQATVAARDVASWRNSLACLLPLGNGAIAVDSDGIATITVQWDDSRGEENLLEFEMSTRL
jgi:type IV pilus assembly protein PilV